MKKGKRNGRFNRPLTGLQRQLFVRDPSSGVLRVPPGCPGSAEACAEVYPTLAALREAPDDGTALAAYVARCVKTHDLVLRFYQDGKLVSEAT